jgi:hypothetical protein
VRRLYAQPQWLQNRAAKGFHACAELCLSNLRIIPGASAAEALTLLNAVGWPHYFVSGGAPDAVGLD